MRKLVQISVRVPEEMAGFLTKKAKEDVIYKGKVTNLVYELLVKYCRNGGVQSVVSEDSAEQGCGEEELF